MMLRFTQQEPGPFAHIVNNTNGLVPMVIRCETPSEVAEFSAAVGGHGGPPTGHRLQARWLDERDFVLELVPVTAEQKIGGDAFLKLSDDDVRTIAGLNGVNSKNRKRAEIIADLKAKGVAP